MLENSYACSLSQYDGISSARVFYIDGKSYNYIKSIPLYHLKEKNIKDLKLLLETLSLDEKFLYEGKTLLTWAIETDQKDIVDMLLHFGYVSTSGVQEEFEDMDIDFSEFKPHFENFISRLEQDELLLEDVPLLVETRAAPHLLQTTSACSI